MTQELRRSIRSFGEISLHQAQRLESFLRLRELRSGSLRSVLSFCRWGGEGFVQNLRDGGQGCAVSVQVLEMLVEALEARGEVVQGRSQIF